MVCRIVCRNGNHIGIIGGYRPVDTGNKLIVRAHQNVTPHAHTETHFAIGVWLRPVSMQTGICGIIRLCHHTNDTCIRYSFWDIGHTEAKKDLFAHCQSFFIKFIVSMLLTAIQSAARIIGVADGLTLVYIPAVQDICTCRRCRKGKVFKIALLIDGERYFLPQSQSRGISSHRAAGAAGAALVYTNLKGLGVCHIAIGAFHRDVGSACAHGINHYLAGNLRTMVCRIVCRNGNHIGIIGGYRPVDTGNKLIVRAHQNVTPHAHTETHFAIGVWLRPVSMQTGIRGIGRFFHHAYCAAVAGIAVGQVTDGICKLKLPLIPFLQMLYICLHSAVFHCAEKILRRGRETVADGPGGNILGIQDIIALLGGSEGKCLHIARLGDGEGLLLSQ